MATGFSNEKSAEYVILNDLYNKIKENCSFFYPFIYQNKRDNTILSMENNIDDLQLIVCFARRPKVESKHDDSIEVTFRDTLFKRSNYFYKKGINSLIGVPIGSRIEEIGFGAKCQWFYPQKGVEFGDSSCEIDKENLFLLRKASCVECLEQVDIIAMLHNAKKWSWCEIIEVLKEWYERDKWESFSRFGFWVRGQRPIFVAYKLKK